MKFNIQRKLLKTAFQQITQITQSIDGASDATSVHLACTEKGITISTSYAEARLKVAEVTDLGSVTLSSEGLSRALSVSGDKFKFSYEEGSSAAHFVCGRSKSNIVTSEVGYLPDFLAQAPKAKVVVSELGKLLSTLKLSSKESSRTLYITKDLIRGESSDQEIGIYTEAEAGPAKEGQEVETIAFSLEAKACDQLAGLVGSSCKIGYDDNFIMIRTVDFRCALPTSSEEPLEMKDQMTQWFETQEQYGYVTVGTKELKEALADASSMLGSTVTPLFDLVLPAKGGTKAKLLGSSSDGEIESDLSLEMSTLSCGITAEINANYLSDILGHYKDQYIKLVIRSDSACLCLTAENAAILAQESSFPFQDVVRVSEAQEEDDEEEDEDDED